LKEVVGLTPTCKCGIAITFPEGKTKAKCPINGCGLRWELRPEGYWAIGLFTISFTPIFTAQNKKKLNHYQKYMEWRNRKGKRV